jgi:hypothetical protein
LIDGCHRLRPLSWTVTINSPSCWPETLQ